MAIRQVIISPPWTGKEEAMSDYLTYAYLRTRLEVLDAWERLWVNARREEGSIDQYLTMGILILIVLAIAIFLYNFRDAVTGVLDKAIKELNK
jgi:hypothetical protein